VYPASTRLLVALALAGLFGLVSPRRSPRPLALAVMSVIVAGWLFGATLIWGTGGPSKLRWGLELQAWQGAALLAVAAVGVLAAGGALRCFAHQNRRVGWILAITFGVAFAGWSAVVRYSVIVALLVLAIGGAALVFASSPPSPSTPASDAEKGGTVSAAGALARWLWNTATAALPLCSGLSFYWWLKVSPKTWIDGPCGLPGWLPVTFIPFVAIPGVTAWLRTRTIGRTREGAAAAVVAATAVTIGVCVLAFLVWFGINKCGE
jgi:hypothetical protein